MGAVHCHGIRGSQLTNRFLLIITRRTMTAPSLIMRRTKTDLMSMVMGAMMLATKVVMIVLMLSHYKTSLVALLFGKLHLCTTQSKRNWFVYNTK